jgi:hypothetical protein
MSPFVRNVNDILYSMTALRFANCGQVLACMITTTVEEAVLRVDDTA